MESEPQNASLFERLGQVPDPRRREARQYPLGSLLGMLILGALNGQGSLRGMWMWGARHWQQISHPLGFRGNRHPPAYGTVWYVLSKVNAEKLEQVIQEWVKAQPGNATETMSLDGKVLRGSRRTDPAEPALEVVTVAAQNLKVVVGQTGVKDGDQLEAALDLLHSLPVKGKLVTADAGLLRRALANQVIAQGGDYLGPLKENAPEVKQAMDVWVAAQVSPPRPGTPS